MKLHIVGSGCPSPVAEAHGSAFVLEVGGDLVLVDCGPGTTYKMARMGLHPLRVNHLFLTHHHFDHNVDFPCFALTRWDQSVGSEPILQVYGPPPTQAFVQRLLGEDGVFFDDWNSRVNHPASHACHRQRGGTLPRPKLTVQGMDVRPGKVTESGAWVATAARVHHVEPWLESLAYRFESDGGSVVFAGDCGDCDELRRFAQGVDTLVIACTHFGRSCTAADLVDVITGTPEVIEIAREANAQRVVLTHVSAGFAKPGRKERAIAQVARAYGGAIVFPREFETVDLSV